MEQQEKLKLDIDFDREHIWHPYTSLVDPLLVYPVVSASGVRLKLENGKELIDGMSSWWCAIHGYNVPEINKAAKDQLDKMSHVMFGGITHEPAVRLAKLLVNFTPKGLEKVFFCDSGSVSVEVALKMAIQYQHSLGKPHKKKFMTFNKGYHGDTSGAMAVCDPVSGMHTLFQDFLPEHFFCDEPMKGFDLELSSDEIGRIEKFFQDHAENSAAFILEPIVQGAGGMRIYSPEYLKLVRQLCDKHEILLIADEIATGFGRTGKLFAVEHADVVPDIMCLGKAMTGGYMTMATTMCTGEVAKVIGQGEAKVLMHGPTFMANPLACSVSIASIELLLKSTWEDRVNTIEETLKLNLSKFLDNQLVKDVRILGSIGVVETKKMINVERMQAYFVEQGVWIRPFRNLLYIMPPYIIENDDLIKLCEVMKNVIEQDDVFLD